MPKNEHFVYVLTGIGDHVGRVDLCTSGWAKRGLDREVVAMGWADGGSYMEKEQKLLGEIRLRKKTYGKVSVVGLSAGGSSALNLMAIAPELIYRAVDDCGRLRPGTAKGFRSFESRTAMSPKFAQSITTFVEREKSLTKNQLERMMVIRPKFGDELVPADTCYLAGALNQALFMAEHGLTILYALASNVITDFLRT